LAGAKKRYFDALTICEEIKDEDFSSQIRTALAFVALQEGKFSDGEALARQSASAFDKTNATASSAWAHAILAGNLLGENNLSEARSAAARAITLSQQAAGETPRYEAALADARVQARLGKIMEARRELEATLFSTRKFGYRLYELRARLAIGEIDLSSESASARHDLRLLEADAKAQGAFLIANQASALLQTK
jgi:hypothetical protein